MSSKVSRRGARPPVAAPATVERSAIEIAPPAPVDPTIESTDVTLPAPVVAVPEIAVAALGRSPEPVAASEAPVQEAAPAVTTPAIDPVAASSSREDTIMATTFETAAANPTAMLGDMTDRTKSAIAKGQKFVEEMNEFAKGNVEAVVESSRITAKGFESMGQDVADYSRRSFESATAALKTMATVKSPTELFKMHSDFMRTSFDAAVAEASKSTEAMLKLAGEAVQPISSRVAVGVEKAKTVA